MLKCGKNVCFIWQAVKAPEQGKDAEEELTVAGDDNKQLPDTAEVGEQRERRRLFDEEWTGISEVLSSVPLEPLVVNLLTKPDEEETAQESQPREPQPRTLDELTNEILDTLLSTFCCLVVSSVSRNSVLNHWTFTSLSAIIIAIITPSQIHRGTGYCFQSISLFVCLYLCLFVSLLARLRENGWTNLHEIFREGAE